jgi:hypothetical protein
MARPWQSHFNKVPRTCTCCCENMAIRWGITRVFLLRRCFAHHSAHDYVFRMSMFARCDLCKSINAITPSSSLRRSTGMHTHIIAMCALLLCCAMCYIHHGIAASGCCGATRRSGCLSKNRWMATFTLY